MEKTLEWKNIKMEKTLEWKNIIIEKKTLEWQKHQNGKT